MASHRFLLSLFLVVGLVSVSASRPVIRLYGGRTGKSLREDDGLYCDSWRFTVETNDAGKWSTVPSRCEQFVKDYVTGDRYWSDSAVVGNDSLDFARGVDVAADGRDAWVFDIDETLLSNLPYYKAHGFGSEEFDEDAFDAWVDLAEAPALPASLSLYDELQQLGFKIFLLTGRSESQRNVTETNLRLAGYRNWEKLILRSASDQGTPAIVYKSKRRSELMNQGFRLQGSSGDQWSDLLGSAQALRSFKLPNPMYYIA